MPACAVLFGPSALFFWCPPPPLSTNAARGFVPRPLSCVVVGLGCGVSLPRGGGLAFGCTVRRHTTSCCPVCVVPRCFAFLCAAPFSLRCLAVLTCAVLSCGLVVRDAPPPPPIPAVAACFVKCHPSCCALPWYVACSILRCLWCDAILCLVSLCYSRCVVVLRVVPPPPEYCS